MLGIGRPDRHALMSMTSPKLRRPRRLLPSRERVRSSAQLSPSPGNRRRSAVHTRGRHSTYAGRTIGYGSTREGPASLRLAADKPRTAEVPTDLVHSAGECQIQTFRPHQASNRLDGSRSESGKPARHIGAIAFILGSEALAERRLLIGNYDNVKKEPDQRAVAEEMPVS